MYIIKAKYILTCNEEFSILEGSAVAFDKEILEIGDFETLCKKYKDATPLDFGNDILMPGFINPHTHLEFSSNKTTLVYGDFINWVGSIVKNRDELSRKAKTKAIYDAIFTMLNSGVTTIGEISSFGSELEECVKTPARVVFFNELLGSSQKVVEENWKKFKTRFNKSLKYKDELFIPAVSIHATYSTHPSLTKKLCDFAKENSLLVSTHFMESNHENEWIREGSGKFKKWLTNFDKDPKPFYSVDSYIENFKNIRTLFTHCVYLDELEKLDKDLHSITHCAYSNRLLSKKRLNLKKVLDSGVNLNIATDGLSSNISLNFFDELRANLLIHDEFNLQELAKTLLLSSTLNSAKALNLNLGTIKSGKLADIAVFKGFDVGSKNELALQLILQTKSVKSLFIQGKRWK